VDNVHGALDGTIYPARSFDAGTCVWVSLLFLVQLLLLTQPIQGKTSFEHDNQGMTLAAKTKTVCEENEDSTRVVQVEIVDTTSVLVAPNVCQAVVETGQAVPITPTSALILPSPATSPPPSKESTNILSPPTPCFDLPPLEDLDQWARAYERSPSPIHPCDFFFGLVGIE